MIRARTGVAGTSDAHLSHYDLFPEARTILSVWEDALARFTASHPASPWCEALTCLLNRLPRPADAGVKNSDTSVDVFFMDVIWVREFAAARWARPLDDKFLPAVQQAFLPATTEVGRYGATSLRVPSRIDAGLLYYRKDLLAK